VRLGYHGSYARNEWGVGSDLDLVAVVTHTDTPFHRRGLEWDLTALPVPTEILVYTEDEWRRLQVEGARFARTLAGQTVWLV
jgi:predicted nucleotidyltransferase